MPHVIVKLWPGKSEQQKARLSEEIVKDVMDILNYGEESVSVAIKEVKSEDWLEKVYEPDIRANSAELCIVDGLTPLLNRDVCQLLDLQPRPSVEIGL